MVLTALLTAVGIAALVTVQTVPQYATSVTFFITTLMTAWRMPIRVVCSPSNG
jgi:hypothetical protein